MVIVPSFTEVFSFGCCFSERLQILLCRKKQPFSLQTLTCLCFHIISPQDKGTFLLVLDAKTFEELGRADVPVNMPYGFHGAFTASE